MPFSEAQIKALSTKLNSKSVKTRHERGLQLSYIEGWHAVAEANRIFGFDGWDRETVNTSCVWQGKQQGQATCAYTARVRIRVRAGSDTVIREGSGSGHASAPSVGEAHERALKEAETDATKRALATFGNVFGLALYDKEQRNVRGRSNRAASGTVPIVWSVANPAGEPKSTHTDPISYCSAVRREMEASSSPKALKEFWVRNNVSLALLRKRMPELTTEKGDHYTEVLSRLYMRRLEELREDHSGPDASATWQEKASQEMEPTVPVLAQRPRRLRNPEHLRRVASCPCVVCGRQPAQAHHIKFAQPRGFALKASDEFAVPLCALHHRALHDAGDERRWWAERKIDPIPEAERLWEQTRRRASPPEGQQDGPFTTPPLRNSG